MGTAIVLGAFALVPQEAAHAQTGVVIETALSPTQATAGNISASLTVRSGSGRCLRVRALTVGVRDGQGDNLDFPDSGPLRICASGYTYSASRQLAPGSYTIFGAYQNSSGAWTSLPAATLVVSGAPPYPPTPQPCPSPSAPQPPVLFNAPFGDSSQWTTGRTSAFPGMGPTNPGDHKLDYIAPTDGPQCGVFDATPRGDGTGSWDTDLVTTEGSAGGFQVKTGETVTATVTLGADEGAWPAIWTWGDGTEAGHGEVDLFEYHPDNPRLLELSNHVGGGSQYVDNVVQPGRPFQLRVHLGQSAVDWYVDGKLVYSDPAGLPANWSAYLIVNLSVSDGTYHPSPSVGQAGMSFGVSGLTVRS